MASESYNSVCNDLYKQIYQALKRRDEDAHRFATKGTAKTVLHDRNLKLLYRSLDFSKTDQIHFDEELFVRRIHKRKLHDFLAILVFAACSVEAVQAFTARLVVPDQWPAGDDMKREIASLPADRAQLRDLFGAEDEVNADKFLTKQACFCTVILRNREETTIENLNVQRLPYLEEHHLARGSVGSVFKVRIAKGHFFDPQTGNENAEPINVARKDYVIGDGFRAQEERKIMDKILNGSKTSKNILQNLGSLQAGPLTYSLFMPLAICDLHQYMFNNHPTKRNDIASKTDLIRCAEGLASGLSFLHTGIRTSELEDMVCYHMDLKPNNVLVFLETVGESARHIWKLSDFGMSRVKIRKRGQGTEREKDFGSWFRNRAMPAEPSVSATFNRRPDGTYLAPESILATPMMKTGSDVWSLGCVISLLFAYLEEGRGGVESYAKERVDHPKADGYERFFLRSTRFMPAEAHPVIRKRHKQLLDKHRHTAEGEAMEFMLGYLEKHVFEVKQHLRHSAEDVRRRLDKTFKLYSQLGATDPGVQPEMSSLGALSPPLSRWWRKYQSKHDHDDSTGNVKSWPLSSPDAFKGSAMSPDAKLIAYWTDVMIVLYTTRSVPQGHPGSDYKLEASDGCFWKSVSLTSEYLVASTTGIKFQCYIFELDNSNYEDASLNDRLKVELELPEIHRLALSSDSEWLACVLRNPKEEDGPGDLLHVRISDLKKAQLRPREEPEVTTEIPAVNMSTMIPEPWHLERLEWPAVDVIQLSFPSPSDIYVVVRPELTAKSREHRVPIVAVSLETKTVNTLNILSQGLDSRSQAGLFTAFAPFHREPACAVVTREKQLHIQGLTGDAGADAARDVQRDVKGYRITRLVVDWHDDRIWALGTSVANHRMLVLEMGVPRPVQGATFWGDGDGDVAVREVAQLPGLFYDDEFTERLSDEEGDKFLLVAALVGPGRRAIYRIGLS